MKKTSVRTLGKQLVALVLFFALSFGAAALSLGYFALPGTEEATQEGTLSPVLPLRPNETTTVAPDSTTMTTTAPVNGTQDPVVPPSQTVYLTNLSSAFNALSIEGYVTDRAAVSLSDRVALYNKLAGTIEAAPDDGVLATYESYTADGYSILRGERLDGEFTAGTEVVVRYTKKYSDEDGSYVTVATEYTIDRKKVQPYMGYLLISREEAGETLLSLCDAVGNVLIDDLGSKKPYYARDNENRPVFTDADGLLYAFDGEKFLPIEEGDLRIWLRYDYPAYPLGTYNNYEAAYDPDTGAYRYINYKTGRTKITTNYFRAFNFADNGLAVVVVAQGNDLTVVSTSKRIQFKPRNYYSYPTGVAGHSLTARDRFRAPDTFGIESIGSAGYDHGWLRLRVQAVSRMSNTLGTVINDREVLVDAEGNYFDIPEGYTLEGYSDGVLLLSRDGLYGYYSIEGYWIAQPIFTYARPFIQGLAVVGSESGTVGMIDTSGNIVLPFVYTSLSDVSSGVITAYCEGIGWETYYLVKN